jgi:hypothetical protein
MAEVLDDPLEGGTKAMLRIGHANGPRERELEIDGGGLELDEVVEVDLLPAPGRRTLRRA